AASEASAPVLEMLLQLVEGPRPILPEKSRKGPVRQQLTASLAGRAVIRLVVRVLDPLDRGSAPRAGLAVAAVNRHPRVERRDLRREIRTCLFDEEVGPPAERRAGDLVQPLDLGVVEQGREAGRGELRLVEDLVRVRVPDAAQDPRVREGPLQSAVLTTERRREFGQRRLQRVDPAPIELRERVTTAHDVELRTLLRTGFREQEGAALEVERSVPEPSRDRCTVRSPLQSSRDHQVNHGEQLALERENDALADALQADQPPTRQLRGWRLDAAQQ